MTTTTTEPVKTPGTVEMVSVEWILKNIEYAADHGPINDYSDIIEIINYKWDGSLSALIPAVLSDGFTVPVAINQFDNNGMTLGNGHHRFVAAILTCADSIPVYWSKPDSWLGCSGDDFMHTDSDMSGDIPPSPHYGEDRQDWSQFMSQMSGCF